MRREASVYKHTRKGERRADDESESCFAQRFPTAQKRHLNLDEKKKMEDAPSLTGSAQVPPSPPARGHSTFTLNRLRLGHCRRHLSPSLTRS